MTPPSAWFARQPPALAFTSVLGPATPAGHSSGGEGGDEDFILTMLLGGSQRESGHQFVREVVSVSFSF